MVAEKRDQNLSLVMRIYIFEKELAYLTPLNEDGADDDLFLGRDYGELYNVE